MLSSRYSLRLCMRFNLFITHSKCLRVFRLYMQCIQISAICGFLRRIAYTQKIGKSELIFAGFFVCTIHYNYAHMWNCRAFKKFRYRRFLFIFFIKKSFLSMRKVSACVLQPRKRTQTHSNGKIQIYICAKKIQIITEICNKNKFQSYLPIARCQQLVTMLYNMQVGRVEKYFI